MKDFLKIRRLKANKICDTAKDLVGDKAFTLGGKNDFVENEFLENEYDYSKENHRHQ